MRAEWLRAGGKGRETGTDTSHLRGERGLSLIMRRSCRYPLHRPAVFPNPILAPRSIPERAHGYPAPLHCEVTQTARPSVVRQALKEGGHPRINLVSLHPIIILPAICRPSISSHRPVCAIADHHPQPYTSRLLRRLHTVLASGSPDCSSSNQEASILGRSPLYLPIPSPGHQRVTERRRPPPLAPPTTA